MGLEPCPPFKIELIDLDRFVKRESDEFSLSGSYPPERFLSDCDSKEEQIDHKALKL